MRASVPIAQSAYNAFAFETHCSCTFDRGIRVFESLVTKNNTAGAAGAAGATSFAPSKDDGVLEDGLIQSHNESEYRAEVRDDSLHGIEPDSEAESGDDDGWLEDTEPPYGFVTGAEFEAIKAVPAAADDPDVLDLFLRLCQYFRGQHPLEEIMWRENLIRQQLAAVLSSFSGVLTRITR